MIVSRARPSEMLVKSKTTSKDTIHSSGGDMIAYIKHVFDEIISSPRANQYLAIVANRFI